MSFKDWVVSHKPSKQWNFDDFDVLEAQLVHEIRESGSLNLISLVAIWASYVDDGTDLTDEQLQSILGF